MKAVTTKEIAKTEGRRFFKKMLKDIEKEYKVTIRLTDKDPDKTYVLKVKYNNGMPMYTATTSKFDDLKSHDYACIEDQMVESIILSIHTKGNSQDKTIYGRYFA